MSLEQFDNRTRNLEAQLADEEARVDAAFADHAARGAKGRVPEHVTERAKDLHRQVRERKKVRQAAMKAARPARQSAEKAARALERHEAKIAHLEKRGPHLEYLIAHYRDNLDEPDMVARYESELAGLPGHLTALRARLPGFRQAARDAEAELRRAFDTMGQESTQ